MAENNDKISEENSFHNSGLIRRKKIIKCAEQTLEQGN